MVDRARLLERLMATFVDELDEHVVSLNDGVLALEKGLTGDERTECLTVMFRAAHSLKGASRAVDQEPIEQLCHVLEDAYAGIRDARLKPDPKLYSLLLATTDAIGAAGQQLRNKAPLDVDRLSGFRSAVHAAVAGEPFEIPASAAGESTLETSSDAPSDPAPAPVQAGSTQAGSTVEESVAAVSAVTAAPSGGEGPHSDLPQFVPAAEPPSGSRRAAGPSTVRVAQDKLDSLLAQTGELLVARQRIDSHPEAIGELIEHVAEWKNEWSSVQRTLLRLVEASKADSLQSGSLNSAARLIESNGEQLRNLERTLERLRRRAQVDSRQLNSIGSAVQDQVHDIRMVPFEEACAGLERAVRDIAATTGKEVELHLEGGDIEVDRSVITGLTDPLIHLVRNAVDHGIELPAERVGSGKPSTARVTVSASLRGSQVEVVVADDGRGLDIERIRDRVRVRRLPEPVDDRELVNCIFLPGFSTAEIVTDVSGRGVGMDVVKSQVERLRGSIETSTQPGLGTRFTLLVPLTLTTISAVFAKLGTQTFLLPSSNVRKLVQFLPSDVRQIQGRQVLPLGESPLPVVSLMELLGRTRDVQLSESGRLTGIVATVGVHEAVFVVDDVTSECEIVVKNLGPRLHRVPHISGATLLQSGEIALLLNVPSLMRTLSSGRRTLSVNNSATEKPADVAARRIMVVDDSVTTRTLIRSILETAGYSVEAAVDGQDAWDRLQTSPDLFEVIVSDVDMPRMNGFQLTESIRTSDRFQSTPVVLVTSRGTEEDKKQGVECGASAYLIKSQFDQTNILETIEQLI